MTLLFLSILTIIFVSFCLHMINRTQSLFATDQQPVCDSCSFPLNLKDMIPLYSWIALRGHCRYCHSPLPRHYLLWEMAGLILILVTSYYLGLTTTLLLLSLTLIAVTDLKLGLIPTPLVLFCAFLALFSLHTESLFMAVGLYTAGYCLHHLFPFPILGRGDVKFLAMAGLWLSLPQLPLFLILTGLGGLLTAFLLRQRTIPLGPALCVALAVGVVLEKEGAANSLLQYISLF